MTEAVNPSRDPEPTLDVQGLLFDMDGVLVSSTSSVLRCWRQWAVHYGVPGAAAITIPHGMRAVEIIDHLKPGLNKEEALRYIEDLEIADVADLRVLPGVRALLASVPAELWTIVTSATRRLLVARLETAGLPVPGHLISAEMVSRGKPDPEPYRRGAELLGLAPADCLVIEDAPSGIQAGVRAGCRVLGVEGTHKAQELWAAGAHFVVGGLEEVSASRSGTQLCLRLAFSRDVPPNA